MTTDDSGNDDVMNDVCLSGCWSDSVPSVPVVLSVTSKTVSVQSRLGEPVLLDCTYWADPSSPLTGSGFAVEWRYQFRGDGRLVLAYDGKTDRLAEAREEGATLDFEGLHRKGNASLILQEAKAHHSGTYICTVFLPYLVAQVTVELEVIGEAAEPHVSIEPDHHAVFTALCAPLLCRPEPPSLSIHPSPLPLAVPGRAFTVQCEAAGFVPLSLDLSWEFKGADGTSRPLGSGSVTGHRQAWDGTFSQSSRLQLEATAADLGAGGQISCVAAHRSGTRRTSVTVSVAGNGRSLLLS